ncbi:MAG: hypothetical protein D6769_03250 [Methanobacteriota archaeon]|nr:MAG: hypothetical protein D6769_03250 [Euryarchaeota archaeon]
MKEKLHEGIVWQWTVATFIFWFVLIGYVLWIYLVQDPGIGLPLFLGFSVLLLIVSYVWARLSYDNYSYDIGEREVNIERGVIYKKYVSIPYGRVQNVNVVRGIFARIFGYSTLQIETAGTSGVNRAEGLIPAVPVDKAMQFRDKIMEKISGKQGL